MSPVQTRVAERPLVKLDGAPLSEEVVSNLLDTRVELVSNGVSQATLRFYDAKFELGAEVGFGKQLEVAFPAPETGEMTAVFTGDVMSLSAEQGPNDLHEFVVVAYDRGHVLARTLAPRVWSNMTYGDIAQQIGSSHGLNVRLLDGYPTITFPHLLQTTDDATFLTELAMRTGARWRVVNRELQVGQDAGNRITATWGEDLLRFNTRVGAAGPVSNVTVRSWDPETKAAVQGSGTAVDHSAAGATRAARSSVYNDWTGTKLVSNRITASAREAEVVAGALRQRLDSAVTQARGETVGNPALMPGTILEVKQMGDHFSGTYVLTSVEHISTPRGFVTRFHAGTHSASTLVDLLGSAPTVHGAMIGLVTNNDDADGGQARVKVKIPALGDSIESDWAPVVALGGGPTTGVQITPSVNDVVLVVFEGGDTRRPIVLGGLWNGVDTPPKPTSETTSSGTTKMWHMQTKAGHKLTFDERQNNNASVTILLADGATKLYLGADKVELWSNNKPLHLKSGEANVKLESNNVTVDAMNITLKARTAVKIEGMSVDVKAQTGAKVTGVNVDVQASAKAAVQGGAGVTLQGATVKIN